MDSLTLRDGRALEYDLTGPASGEVLLYHHGTPGCAFQPAHLAAAVHARGLRLLTYSRAGYGASDRRAGRSVADNGTDMAELLDHVGADGFWTGGWSGGGPHTLATCAAFGDRVRGALLLAGVGPHDAPDLDFLAGMGEPNIEEFGAARQGEAVLRPELEAQRGALVGMSTEQVVDALGGLLPPADKAAMTGRYGEDSVRNIVGGIERSVDGWLDDDLAFVRPWGFDLTGVTAPVHLWQGDADLMVPAAHGDWLAAHVPGAQLHRVGGGHLSLGAEHLDAMLDALLTAPR